MFCFDNSFGLNCYLAPCVLKYSRMIERVPQSIEEIDIVLLDNDMVGQAEGLLSACEHCAENAAIALDYVFDALTGCDPSVTEYLMHRPASCPSCLCKITEKTLVVV